MKSKSKDKVIEARKRDKKKTRLKYDQAARFWIVGFYCQVCVCCEIVTIESFCIYHRFDSIWTAFFLLLFFYFTTLLFVPYRF